MKDLNPALADRTLVVKLDDPLGTTPAWQEDASCAQADPEAFFPEQGGSANDAKRICGRCPVQVECLSHALEYGEEFGVWGGMTQRELELKRRAAA